MILTLTSILLSTVIAVLFAIKNKNYKLQRNSGSLAFTFYYLNQKITPLPSIFNPILRKNSGRILPKVGSWDCYRIRLGEITRDRLQNFYNYKMIRICPHM
jgi:hypothetical protein